jgi:hypothetical protein
MLPTSVVSPRFCQIGWARDLAPESIDAGRSDHRRVRRTAQLLARLTAPAMTMRVGTRVRFYEPYRPPQVRWGTTDVIVDTEERRTPHGHESWVRARFGAFITPWIEEWRLEGVS